MRTSTGSFEAGDLFVHVRLASYRDARSAILLGSNRNPGDPKAAWKVLITTNTGKLIIKTFLDTGAALCSGNWEKLP